MVTRRKILVPVDFNERSIGMALTYAAEWAQRFNMEIDLLHVIEDSGLFSKIFSNEDSEKLKEKIRQKLVEIADKTEREYKVRVNAIVTQGRISPKINDVAELLNSDLIIMSSGNTYSQNEDDPVIGANTHRVVRVTDTPVLIVRHPNYPQKMKNLLVPMDLTNNSRAKIPYVVDIAKRSNAKVTLISGTWGDIGEESIKRQNVIINQSVEFVKNNGIECDLHIIPHGKSSKDYIAGIANYAKENDMDLIVVVGRAESITERYMDNTAQDLIRLSPIPVLCIAPKNAGMSVAGRI